MSSSALIGSPPSTEDDYWVVRSILQASHIHHDPKVGAQIPPMRPPPDQYHSETRGPGIIAGMVVGIVVMVFITVSRLMMRLFKKELRFGPDDWLIIPGVLLVLAWPVLQIASVCSGGAGKHTYDLTYHEFAMFNWISTTQKLVFFVSVGIVKMSITLFNMRLTGLSSRRWMTAHWAFFAVLVAYTLTALFINLFQCNPQKAHWNLVYAGKLPSAPTCLSVNLVGSLLSIWHVVMDFCLLTVPIIVLWKLQMPWSTKIRLFLVFGVGFMSCIGSIVRQIYQGHLKSDIPWNYTGVITWSMIDLTFGVIAANLPVFSSLIPRTWGFLRRKRSRFSTNKGSGLSSGNTIGNGVQRLDSKASQRCDLIGHEDFEMKDIYMEPVLFLPSDEENLERNTARHTMGFETQEVKPWGREEV